MRYIIMVIALLADIAPIIAVSVIIYNAPCGSITWILTITAYLLWQDMGAFSDWDLASIRKKFLANAKKVGL